MKLNEEFLIHNTGNGELLIPIGEESKKFHGIVKLNETASLIAHLLNGNDLSLEELLKKICEEYPDDDPIDIKPVVIDFLFENRWGFCVE